MFVLKFKLKKGEVLLADTWHDRIPTNIPLVCLANPGSSCNGVEDCNNCALSGTHYGCDDYVDEVIKPKLLSALAKITSQIKAQ